MEIKAFLEYLKLERNYSSNTLSAYKRDLEQFTTFCKDNYEEGDLTQISYPIIRSWVVSLVEGGISNRSVNRKIASLKAFFKFAMLNGSIATNPLAGHKSLRTSKKVELPFSESEMEKIFDEVAFEDSFEGRRDQLVIDLLYTTGIRRAELISLQRSDVDLSSGTLKVLGKRNKERILPLTEGTLTLLKTYLNECDMLFPSMDHNAVFCTKSGGKIYETLVYRIINGYFSMVSSKVKKSPHILRHTFATHLLNKGADLNSVKELLGHSSLASTQVYTHNSIAELKKIHAASHPRSK